MKVNVYTIPDCPYCNELKERLTNMSIEFTNVDVSLDENEETFNKIMEVSGVDSVPCVTVGKHLLAPTVNFNTIEQAANIVKHILDTEG
jgi:glutaredoxin